MRTTQAPPLWLSPESDVPERHVAAAWGPWLVLATMTFGCAVVFTWLSLARHGAYQSHAFDLGNMDQAVWNTLHGQVLRFTDMAVGGQVLTTRLAIHVEPLLAVIAPLYLIRSDPGVLLTLQAWVAAAGAIPAYLLARAAIRRPWLSLVFPAAYLAHPSLQNAVLDDFHAVTLSACFLLWALYFLYVDIVPGFAVAAVLAGATKEEVGMLVAMLGLVLLLRRRWYAALMSVVCGLGWFLVSLMVIIPAFNPAGRSPYLGRYSYLGHNLEDMVRTVVAHPAVPGHVLLSAGRLTYLWALLHPLGYVSLLGLPVLVLAVPALLINMLSTDPTMYSGFYQYSAEVVPYVVASAAVGVGAAARFSRDRHIRGSGTVPIVLCLLVLGASLLDSRRYGFTPLADGYLVPSPGGHQRLEDRLLRMIPPGTVVAAADEIEPHLSQRNWIYLLPTVHPTNGPAARYIVLDASIPSLPVEPHTLHAVTLHALHSGYGVQSAGDGLLILRKGAPHHSLPTTFFQFLFDRGSRTTSESARWGRLWLAGITVHPRSGQINRSRPSIDVETYWRRTGRIPSSARIAFYVSPVYTGAHPAFSRHWVVERDSPAWDWMPLSSWPTGRLVRAQSLPLLPGVEHEGKVDVAIGVRGVGAAQRVARAQRIANAPTLLRVATIGVGY